MNSNKFLETYPQLRHPQIGDIIEVTKSLNFPTNLPKIGDIGKIINTVSYSKDYFVINFNKYPHTGKIVVLNIELFKTIKYHG